ncbi:hypothetical protein LCGC14_1282860 [marine sediment metagenome]|uniref:Uncharacterized protein n=1 Tax=marine sediment metagenome TaxID=412755 RepID=A0A0F9LFT1_9ZZZZ
MKRRWRLGLALIALLILIVPYEIDTSDNPPWHICGREEKRIQIAALVYSANADFMCGKLYIFRMYLGAEYRPRALSVRYAWCVCWEKKNMLTAENFWEYDWENPTWEDKMNVLLIDWEW